MKYFVNENTVLWIIGLSIAFIFFASIVQAAENEKPEYSIGYAPICKHFNGNPDLNEINHGLFLSYNQWEAGTFNNSSNIQSWFLGRNFRTKKWTPIDNDMFLRLNIHVGLLYGYEKDMPNIHGWTLGTSPTFEIGYRQFSVETMYMPSDGGVVAFLFKWTWQKKD